MSLQRQASSAAHSLGVPAATRVRRTAGTGKRWRRSGPPARLVPPRINLQLLRALKHVVILIEPKRWRAGVPLCAKSVWLLPTLWFSPLGLARPEGTSIEAFRKKSRGRKISLPRNRR